MSKTREARRAFWQQLIARQQQTGLSVRAFCQQYQTSEYSFYQWRKRLNDPLPVKFALVETHRSTPTLSRAVEVLLSGGERVRIEPGTDVATLRVVLSVLREPR
jgi:hypothetical protein